MLIEAGAECHFRGVRLVTSDLGHRGLLQFIAVGLQVESGVERRARLDSLALISLGVMHFPTMRTAGCLEGVEVGGQGGNGARGAN